MHTDGYDVYGRLEDWGYGHKTVCHACGEYARDEDGDGFCEVHVNTAEGLWSLLRSWLRPHRGVSREKLPLYSPSSGWCTTRGGEGRPSSPRSSGCSSREPRAQHPGSREEPRTIAKATARPRPSAATRALVPSRPPAPPRAAVPGRRAWLTE